MMDGLRSMHPDSLKVGTHAMNKKTAITGVNNYDQQLSQEDIARKAHRGKVGGFWEELGQLQFEFMVKHGLKPSDRLLDIGCGCLRGGVHFIPYLATGHYHGLDINPSLLAAAQAEIEWAELQSKQPQLLLDEGFALHRFNTQFEAMIAVSLFTHLPMNIIMRCLAQVRQTLQPEGRFYATFFIANHSLCLDPLQHQPGNITTHFDQDPFHYSMEEIQLMARHCGLQAELIGEWDHPRAQQMVLFKHP